MGNLKNNISMRVAILLILSLALSMVATQAPVPTHSWTCAKVGNNYEPTWGPTSGRRLQAMKTLYCPIKLSKPAARRLQALQGAVPPSCGNSHVRRLQVMVVFKCPVTVSGHQCFKNTGNSAKCPA